MSRDPVQVWRHTFREGWLCAECQYRKTVVMYPEGYPVETAPIPQRMCLVSGANQCPGVKQSN